MKKDALNRLFSAVASISLLANSLLSPIAVAYAQDASSTPEPTPAGQTTESSLSPSPSESPVSTLTPEPTPTTEVTPTPELTPSPTAEPSATPSTTPQPAPEPTPTSVPVIEKVCLTNEIIIDSKNEDWNIDGDKAETKEPVKLGIKYNFPQENKVSVTFKCLPKDESLRTALKIQQVKVSDLKLPSDVKTNSEYAYDITTGMTDGTFEYDVTLPKPENSTAEVSYIEKTIEEVKTTEVKTDEVKQVDESQIGQEGSKVKASGIDHFTIYIATYSSSSFSTTKDIYEQSKTVYAKATGLTNGDNIYYKIEIINPNGTSVSNNGCTRKITSLTHSYSLASDAQISANWKALIRESVGTSKEDAQNKCNSNQGTTTEKTFEVIAPLKPDLTAEKTNNVGGNATLNQAFNWKIHITNIGNASAVFDSTEKILTDNLPSSGATYGSPSVSNKSGVTGNINCSISSNDLNCTASGSVTINAGGSLDVSWSVTPTATGSLENPRSSSYWDNCEVDPDWGDWGYDVIVESNENNNTCSDTVNVAAFQPVANPILPQTCGLDIALVIDSSGSIDGSMTTMKNAFKSFVDALAGTPTQFSVTDFDTTATVTRTFTSDTGLVKAAIDSASDDGWTNWEDGLTKGRSTFDPRTKPNLVIFASDGNPNTIVGGSGGGASLQQATDKAVLIANDLKSTYNSRILVIGITGNEGLNMNSLMAISGTNVNTGDIRTSDVITTDFNGLATQLANFAKSTCGGTITVNKYINSVAPENRAGTGWTFNIAGTSKITDSNGQTDAVEVSAGSGYSVTESAVLPGYTFSSASCTGATNNGSPSGNGVNGIQVSNSDIVSCNFVNTENYTPTRICHASDSHTNPYVSNTPATLGQLMGHADHTGPVWYSGIGVQWGDIIPPVPVFLPTGLNWSTEGQAIWNNDCNSIPQTGSITITKDVVPNDSSVWDFIVSGQTGPFTHNDLGDGQSYTFENLEAGSYNITETIDPNYSTTVTCGGVGPLNQNGFLGTVFAGQDLACTFTNTRNTGTIELKKAWSGTGGQTTLRIGTSVDGSEVDTQLTGAAGTPPLTTGQNTVNTGTYYTTETGGLTDYTYTGESCFDDVNNNGVNDNEPNVLTGSHASVLVGSGQHVICTLTNVRNTGLVKVNKLVDTNANGTFETINPAEFTWSLDGSGTNAMGGTVSGVNTGNHNVNENSVSNYHFAGWYLTSDTSKTCANTINNTLPASVSVVNGQLTEITLCNARDTGNLRVQKIVDYGNVTDWYFSLDGGTSIPADTSGVVDFGQVTTFENHTITETGASMNSFTTTISGTNCNSSPVGNGIATATVIKGGTTTCIFTNDVHRGSITINKNVTEGSGDVDFEFTPSWQGTFWLSSNNTQTFSNLLPNSYSIAEQPTTGWRLDSLLCRTDKVGKTMPLFFSNIASFNLDAGENVECDFTNTQLFLNLSVTKSDAGYDPIYAGQKIHYVLNWSITGNTTANNLTLRETINSPFTFDSDDNPGWVSTSAGEWSYSLDSPAAPTSGSVTIVLGVPAGYSGNLVTNTINLLAQDPVNPAGNALSVQGSQDTTILHYGSISGKKFNDLNGDHLYVNTTTDPNLQGWTIRLDQVGTSNPPSCSSGTVNGEYCEVLTNSSGNYSFGGLLVGQYIVSEVLQTGWVQTRPNVSFGGEGAQANGTYLLTINSDDNKTNRDFGNFENVSIKICKKEDGDGNITSDNDRTPVSGWSMTLYDDAVRVGSEQVTGMDGCYTWTDLGPGNYSVTEETRTGWINLNNNTSHGFGILQSGSGESLWTFVNSRLGKVIVKKVMIGGTDSFDFSGDVQGTISSNNGTLEVNNVIPGTDPVSIESPKTGWDLTDITCDDSDSLFDIPTRLVIFRVGSGETVTCTFTNTKRGSITIIKNTYGGDNTFDFTSNFGISSLTTSAGMASQTTNNLIPGSGYSISETVPTGWDLNSAVCDHGTTSAIEVQAGHDTVCTFTNTQRGSITAHKFEDNNQNGVQDGSDVDLSGWTVGVYDGSGCEGQVIQYGFQVTDENGDASFPNLIPGLYSVKEELDPQSGWQTTTLVCQDITVNPGQSSVVNIGNFEYGTAYVDKYEDTDGVLGRTDGQEFWIGNPTFTFRLYQVNSTWTLKGQADTDSNGRATFDHLLDSLGDYRVCEVKKAGWEDMRSLYNSANNNSGATDEYPVCDGITVSTSGYQVYSEFGNIHYGAIDGHKFNDLSGNGNQETEEPMITHSDILGGVVIFIDSNDNQMLDNDERFVNTDDAGYYKFDNLLAGSYDVCEVVPQGWVNTFPAFSNCHLISVTPGQTVSYDFGNILIQLELGLAKSNSVNGSTVTYTLVLTNTGNQNLNTIKVIDALPGGFTYIAGSSQLDGVTISDPTVVGGALVWTIDGLLKGSENSRVLTYQVTVGSDNKDGQYTNQAYAIGTFKYGREQSENKESNISTSLVVISFGQAYGGSLSPQVLGASTELPATGSSTWILLLAALTGIFGVGLKIYGRRMKHGKN